MNWGAPVDINEVEARERRHQVVQKAIQDGKAEYTEINRVFPGTTQVGFDMFVALCRQYGFVASQDDAQKSFSLRAYRSYEPKVARPRA